MIELYHKLLRNQSVYICNICCILNNDTFFAASFLDLEIMTDNGNTTVEEFFGEFEVIVDGSRVRFDKKYRNAVAVKLYNMNKQMLMRQNS